MEMKSIHIRIRILLKVFVPGLVLAGGNMDDQTRIFLKEIFLSVPVCIRMCFYVKVFLHDYSSLLKNTPSIKLVDRNSLKYVILLFRLGVLR